MARFVGRDNVRKQLAPLEGEPGRTSYADGIVRIEHAEEILLVRPPFGLAHEGQYDVVRLAPLFDALAEDHVVGALLVRWRDRIEFIAFGGHRPVVTDVLAASPQLDWLAERALPRFFAVAEPRQRVLERLPYELYAAELSGE